MSSPNYPKDDESSQILLELKNPIVIRSTGIRNAQHFLSLVEFVLDLVEGVVQFAGPDIPA